MSYTLVISPDVASGTSVLSRGTVVILPSFLSCLSAAFELSPVTDVDDPVYGV